MDTPPGDGYFLYHSIGMFPGKAGMVAEALAEAAGTWGAPDDTQWAKSLALRQRFIGRWSRLIGAPAGTLTTSENVTTALSSLLGALPERYLRGRKLLIAEDCFPSLHFLLSGLIQRRGFELVTVRKREGELWVRDEDLLAQWDAQVGVALLTFVASTSSHRCNVRALAQHAGQHGTLVGVDITQGVGIVPFDVSTGADFVVGSSLKWLCGVSGAGILQVREALLAECEPELRGWFSQEQIFSWALDGFRYAPDARRFDHGTPSILPFAACLPALEWHARQDPMALLAHNRRIIEVLVDAGTALELELASPRRADDRGGSLMFKLPERVDPQALLEKLREQQVYADARGALLRLSPGNLTTLDGLDRLLRAIRAALRAA